MSKLPDGIRRLIGPLVAPFERRNAATGEVRRPVGDEEEDYTATNHHVTKHDPLPADVERIRKLPRTEEEGERYRYLWIINDDGLFLQLEATPGARRLKRRRLCHTNLTAGRKAYQGGELWFHTDGTVYLNHASGRYGASTPEHEEGVWQYFKAIYAKVKRMPELRDTGV